MNRGKDRDDIPMAKVGKTDYNLYQGNSNVYVPEEGGTGGKAPKKIIAAACAVLLIAVLVIVVGSMGGKSSSKPTSVPVYEPTVCENHIWVSATCTKAQFCSLCGVTSGNPLDHAWMDGSCTEAVRCSMCGAAGDAMGHLFMPATYLKPMTCVNCGVEEGKIRGYTGSLDGEWSDEKVNVRGNSKSSVFETNGLVEDCSGLSMYIMVSNYSGFPFGTWYLYGREADGDWVKISEFEIEEGKTYNDYMLEFSPSVSFDALTIAKQEKYDSYSINYSILYGDVYKKRRQRCNAQCLKLA